MRIQRGFKGTLSPSQITIKGGADTPTLQCVKVDPHARCAHTTQTARVKPLFFLSDLSHHRVKDASITPRFFIIILQEL